MFILQFLRKKSLGFRNKFFCPKYAFILLHIAMNTLYYILKKGSNHFIFEELHDSYLTTKMQLDFKRAFDDCAPLFKGNLTGSHHYIKDIDQISLDFFSKIQTFFCPDIKENFTLKNKQILD